MTTQCSQNQDGKKSVVSVYLLTFPNGKCYVGVSVRPKKRLAEHLKFAGDGAEYALHNAIRKHGKPTMTILASNLTQQEAFAMEVMLASNKRQRTPEEKQRMIAAAKKVWQDPAHRAKVNAAREAKQAELRATNPEWVAARAAKMSASMKAKWEDPVYLAKMAQRKPPVIAQEARMRAAAKRKAGMTAEKRAAIAEKTRQQWVKRKALQSE